MTGFWKIRNTKPIHIKVMAMPAKGERSAALGVCLRRLLPMKEPMTSMQPLVKHANSPAFQARSVSFV